LAEPWTYVLDETTLVLPSDLPEEGTARPVRYGSTLAVFVQALTLYRRYFVTFAAIFLFPMLIGEVFVRAVRILGPDEPTTAVRVIEFALQWVATVVAFAPLVYAVSDVCVGNQPGLRRSYQRVELRTFAAVTAVCALATLLILAPFAIGGALAALILWIDFESAGVGTCLFVPHIVAITVTAVVISIPIFTSVLYVPVIVVVERGVGIRDAFRRSRWLSRGYTLRTATVIVIVVLILLLSGTIYQTLSEKRVEVLGVLFAKLLGPVPYIAATLIYYDLRARKEGYGIAERPEDLS